ncbi:hypothetical protein Pdsh_02460 [Pyrodictium delaneyi]|uniref:CopG family transcriptional regulator n=2 Tax=Pyrodictium delaneyi TaxID=1273541 RepID=A0A211YRW5_9CREN|nr:hypothetical protein Pdsh_02460 [Pyrodictium delaneyi]
MRVVAMPRIVAVKLPDNVYRELEEKAKREGFPLVSDYLRYLVMRELGLLKGEGIEALVERIVSEKLGEITADGKIEVVPPDLEKLAARLERRIQDMINPWTAKIDSLSSKLAEAIERLEALEERVKNIEEALESQRRREVALARYQPQQAVEKRGEHYQRGRRRSAIERLREQGVVFEHDVQWLRDRDAFFERLRREGALILDIGGERVAVDRGFWENFREKIEQLPTANDDEIKLLLTDTQYALFQKLKEAGLIYFDASKRAWRFVEEPQAG